MLPSELEKSLKAYQKNSLKQELSVSEPYNITKLLFQGIFDKLAQAKGAIERKDLALKSQTMGTAMAILEHLRNTLDFSYNKELAQNLFDLYTFCIDKLTDATFDLDTSKIDDVLKVLKPIKDAWDKIPLSARKEAEAQRSQAARYNPEALATGHV